MSEAVWLLRQGWRNVWQEKTIFLFAFLTVIGNLFLIVIAPLQKEVSGLYGLLSITALLTTFSLIYVSDTGMLYIAYRQVLGEVVTLSETWQVVRKFWKRVAVFNILIYLFLATVQFEKREG